MITNISTSAEVLEQFEKFMLKQFTYTVEELRSLRLYHKAAILIEDDTDYWANQSLWNLYDEASLA